MSYDLRVYFASEAPPHAAIRDALMGLPPIYDHVHEADGSGFAVNSVKCIGEWTIGFLDDSDVWITLEQLEERHHHSPCVPTDSKWLCNIDVGAGRRSKSIFVLFAIPWLLLSSGESCVVHDCQWHDSNSLHTYLNPCDWQHFSVSAMNRLTKHLKEDSSWMFDAHGKLNYCGLCKRPKQAPDAAGR